jgi:hypothetical protein
MDFSKFINIEGKGYWLKGASIPQNASEQIALVNAARTSGSDYVKDRNCRYLQFGRCTRESSIHNERTP